jgi:heterogeneous nuclear rnp K-like protein 2
VNNEDQMYGDSLKGEDAKAGEAGETQELRILIDNNQVGGIIGKAGANVSRVREQTGIFLSILKAENNVTERVMVLKGQYEQLVESIRMIAELMIEADAKLKKKEPQMSEGQTELRLLVHRHAVGAVIGKGGAVIKETQGETGARVQVSQEPLPQSTEKTVTVSGTPLAIHQATMRVLAQLRESPLRPNTKSYPYVPGVTSFPQNPFGPGPPQGYAQPFNPYSMQPQQAAYGGHSPAHDPYGMAGAATANTQKIAIPTICAGCVIGKGGAVIRDLRAQSGTNISIADADPATLEERVVTLTGTPQGIQTAIFLIRQLVEQYQPPPQTYQ